MKQTAYSDRPGATPPKAAQHHFVQLAGHLLASRFSVLPLVIVLFLFSLTLQAQVSVTATAGTLGPTPYTTLKDAFDAVNAGTHQGAITISLTGSTTETASAVLNASGTGSSSYTSLLITPSGGAAREINGAIVGHLIDLDGADNVTINGLNTGGNSLTITNTGLGASSALRFINDATGNTVTNCTLRAATTTGIGVVTFSTGLTTGNDNNTISSCNITGPNSTDLPLNGIYSLGSSAVIDNSNIIVSSNNIFDYFSAGSASSGINANSFNSNWTISENKFYQTTTRTYTTGSTHQAIFVASGNGHSINNNTIGFASAAGTGVYTMAGTVATRFIGINLAVGTTTATSVQGNTIAGISLATSSGANTANGVLCGINITAGNVNVGTIAGNTIGSITGTGSLEAIPTTTQGTIVGINSSTIGTVVISNNNIGAFTSASPTATVAGGIFGINISGASTSTTITNNQIGNSTADNMRAGVSGTTTGNSIVAGINLSSTPSVIVISNNTIRNLSSFGTGTTGYVRGIVTAVVTAASSCVISSNTIANLTSNCSNVATGNGLTAAQGIYFGLSITNVLIADNIIFNISLTNTGAFGTNATGISHTNGTNTVITRNRIYGITNASTNTVTTAPGTASGIHIRGAVTAIAIHNNMISLGSGQNTNTAFIGIWYQGGGTAGQSNLYHNSVFIEGVVASGAQPSFGFVRGNFSATAITPVVDIRNNIFVNNRSGGTGKHYAISNNFGATVSATGWGLNASNYNVLNTADPAAVGHWGTDRTFAAWQTASNSDANSFSGIAVNFASPAAGDLHLNMGLTPTLLESTGQTIASVTVDYDNQTRPGPPGSVNGGGIFPDLGADEFDGVPLDIFPPTITYTPLVNSCITGSRTLVANITDLSGVPTAGIGLPVLYWSINAPAGPFTTSTATHLGGSQYQFSLGAGSVLGNVIYYYIVAQDNVVPTPNVGVTPAAGAGGLSFNPPAAATPPTTPSSYTNIASLAGGTYTVGVGGAYSTLTAAVQAYNTNCIGGPVVFELIDATYPSETFPIVINQNPGASATNTLTIRPATGVSPAISGSVANALIRIFGNYVTIDGSNNGTNSRNLTITQNGTTTPSVILIGSTGTTPVTNVTVKNCIVINGAQTATAILVSDGATSGSAGYFNNITIQNNNIQRAFIGIFAITVTTPGNGSGLNINTNDLITAGANAIRLIGIYVQGVDGATVMNNNIANLESATAENDRGIWFATGTTNSTISGNNISTLAHTGTGGNAPIGINLTPAVSNANINVSGNLISDISSAGTLQSSGISLAGASSQITIQKNRITNIKNSNSGGWGANGIQLSSTSTMANTNVYNNFISDVAAFGYDLAAGVNDNGYGIIVTSGAGYNIDYNSVHMNTNQAASGLPAAFNVTSGVTAAGAINLRNNIFANSQTVGTERYAIYSGAPASVFGVINRNNYYTSGPNLGFLGANQANLAAWQTATSQDANSLSVAPVFVSPTDLHLDPSSNPLLNAAAAPLAGITMDIDGDLRNATTPDIGADEFNVAGVCTGTPAPGNTLSTANPVCSGTNFTLSLSGSPIPGTGITYQWQSSPNGSSWTDILGAMSSTLTTNQSSTTWYQCVVTCTNSSQSSTSTPLQVTLDVPANCYCAAGATSTSFEKISNVEFNTINNPSVSTAGYEDFTSVSTTVNAGGTYTFTGTISGGFSDDEIIVWIDYNQDGDFDDPGEEVFNSPTGIGPHSGNITIPLTATIGATRMRVRLHDTVLGPNTTPCGNSTYGQVEDYTINILASSACTGTPAPGNTLSTANPVCSGTNFTLSLSGSPITGTGITYQWQSSPNGSSWTDILGATSSTLTTNQTSTTWYQCIVTCTNSSQSSTSTPLQVTLDVPANCYCAAGATSTSPSFEKISRVEFNTIDNTSTSSDGYEDFTAVSTTVNPGSTYLFTGTISNPWTDDEIIVWIDYNQDGDFTGPGEEVFNSPTGNGPHSGNITIPLTATLGSTRMRVRLHDTVSGPNTTPCGNSTWGQVEDYTIIISSCTPVTWYQDSDGDTYGNPMMTLSSCTQPLGYVADNTDCNDSNNAVYPGAPEVCDNSIDDDCDMNVDETLITWTGAGDGVNWTDGANWNNGGAQPQACNDIVIPAGADVTVPPGANVVGRSLDVSLTAILTVALTAIMTIMP